MMSAFAIPDVRVCVFDGVTIRVDYATGRITAATGTTAEAWAAAPGAIHGARWGLSFGTEEADVEFPPSPPPTVRHAVAAAAALVVTLVVRSLGPPERAMSRLTNLVATAAGLTTTPSATGEAEQAVCAVRWASRWAPFRVACLEESAAAVLVLALRRRSVTWCHGVAPDPVQFHAWIQAHGSPVAEPPTTSRYTVLRAIP
ncbi:lasso peptide biosynthesis B2 protein [Promicromonospora kroppenstedtii]|uniref:lasso peptide biosynthesis B2 protein n=1 Tax=Promicromonospora kroppenstedtii TaxID=440482 RepID=UPI000688540B|nr:lasso peptide biosynthesis B2 protein [Promicromonospora kroppenstedtii]